MIAISSISFGEEVEREVLDTLRSGIVAQGPKVKRLEDEFEQLVNEIERHVAALEKRQPLRKMVEVKVRVVNNSPRE